MNGDPIKSLHVYMSSAVESGVINAVLHTSFNRGFLISLLNCSILWCDYFNKAGWLFGYIRSWNRIPSPHQALLWVCYFVRCRYGIRSRSSVKCIWCRVLRCPVAQAVLTPSYTWHLDKPSQSSKDCVKWLAIACDIILLQILVIVQYYRHLSILIHCKTLALPNTSF